MLSFNLAQSTTFETDSTPTPSQGHETSNDDDSASFVSATPASRCDLSESSNDGDSDPISSGIEVGSATSAQSLLESASPGSLSTTAGPRARCWTTGSSAERPAKALGSEKANQAKKRDFASTFREFSEKRLEAETQWRRAEIDESRANRLASHDQANKDREERQEDRKFRFKETQSQLRRDIFIQLLERGRSEDDALTLLDRIFPA